MNTPLIVWLCLLGTIIAIFAVITVRKIITTRRNNIPFISVGSEEEEFFVPGDITPYHLNEEYE